MVLSRIIVPIGRYHANISLCKAAVIVEMQARNASTMQLTKNLTLFSNEKKLGKPVNFKLEKPEHKPLVVMLSWLMARRKHIRKYADIYLKLGFDVLNVSVSPWQLLWPTKGTQMVAKDILLFLDGNSLYNPLLLHGFSVGGYVWGEVMVQMVQNQDRYQHVIDRMAGQIWDSAADISEIPIGVPTAVFPRNQMLQSALKQYILYHLRTFNKVATCHYIRASQMFHSNCIPAPALFFLSKTDPIGALSSNLRAKENWENNGIHVTWKVFEKSPHVGHFRFYPKEYVLGIHEFLESINLGNAIKENKVEEQTRKADKNKLQAKL